MNARQLASIFQFRVRTLLVAVAHPASGRVPVSRTPTPAVPAAEDLPDSLAHE